MIMNDWLNPVFNTLPSILEKRWWGFAVACIVAAAGALGVAFYQDRYRASATVYVDARTMLGPLLQGLTVQPDVDNQVELLARTLLSRPNLLEVIERNRLLPAGASERQRAELAQKLSKRIRVQINGRENIFEISDVGTDPSQTLGVVRTLLDLFVTRGVDGNRTDSSRALAFIDAQIALYDGKLRAAESRLKDFKTAHPDYAGPGAGDSNAQQAQLQDMALQLRAQLAAAASSRDALRRQLGNVRPTLAPSLLPGVAAPPSELDQRIAMQRSKLDELRQTYTDAYPDVVAARETLQSLLRERRAQVREPGAEVGAHYSDTTNPVYQQIQVSLAQADANVASLQSQVGNVQQRLAQLRDRARRMPELDAQYVQLARDYNVLNENYQKLVQRREQATLSRNQDDSRRQGYFRVVDPPRLSPGPLFPRRGLLIALLLVVAAGAGAAAAGALAVALPTYRSARQLRQGTDRPVLGTVSMVETPGWRADERRDRMRFLAGSAAVSVVLLAWSVADFLRRAH